MSRTRFCTLFGCMLSTGMALANPTATVTHTSGYYYGSGGEFTLTPNADLTALLGLNSPWESFSVERTDSLSLGATYAALLNTEAMLGGFNNGAAGPGGGDPLDARTAYLYARFQAGALAGYDYTPGTGRINSARALQEVIWYLEDEAALTWTAGSLADTLYTAAVDAVTSGSWTGLGSVRVLNLYELDHAGDLQYRRQDMLAITTPIPAPRGATLGSLGVCLVGWLHRRRTWQARSGYL